MIMMMETIDSLFYESDDSQSSFNLSKHFSLWVNSSQTQHFLFRENTNEFLSLTNATHEFDRALNSTEDIINMNNESFSLTTTGNFIESTTFNSSVIDDGSWWQNWNKPIYPSGYSQSAIVILAFFITCIMILIVVGNMLVCIAIATEKSLKPVQNWFIASLAVSDFLLGLIVMPFSLARELMGYWMFGQFWCDIHEALDVLLCTASINNLFMISLDRYWSVTQAVKYLKKRTPMRAALMVIFVWAFSAAVSLPPLVGWKIVQQPQNEYPQCNLSDDIGYVLYSAIGSFYFPAAMMVFVYARIFVAARKRARKNLKQKRLNMRPEVTNDPAKDKSTTTTTCTSLSNANDSPPENPIKDQNEGPSQPNNVQIECHSEKGSVKGVVTIASPTLSPPQIVIEAIEETPHPSPIRDKPPVIENNFDSSDTIDDDEDSSDVQIQSEPIRLKRSPKLTIVLPECNVQGKASVGALTKQNGSATRTSETRFISNDDDSDAIESPVSKDTLAPESKSFLSAPKLMRSPYGSTLSIADYDDSDLCIENSDDDDNKKQKKKGKVQYHNPPVTGRHTPLDAERHKRKIAKARERRATLILGLIMAAFITAWLPFFVIYVLSALCESCKPGTGIPNGYFAVAFWLGYCNSAANPIIYTIFNRDFRRAFRKILFK